MASGGGYYSPYYSQPAAPCYYYNYPQQQQQRARCGGGWHPSVCVFVLLATVSLIAATTVFSWCESAVGSLLDQLRGLLILSPLLLIVAVQLWMATGGGGVMCNLAEMVAGGRRRPYGYGYGYGPYGGGGGGSSPWGVALALVLVLFLVSYHSSFQERWFPRLGR
ncbi:unnamed protein product [Urochloa decumbens]|uniref:Uncharacterized protein n=1 Tax=Urochloa decumbens TaxID=240449 RepID=A0ABC9E7E9_9POAL